MTLLGNICVWPDSPTHPDFISRGLTTAHLDFFDLMISLFNSIM